MNLFVTISVVCFCSVLNFAESAPFLKALGVPSLPNVQNTLGGIGGDQVLPVKNDLIPVQPIINNVPYTANSLPISQPGIQQILPSPHHQILETVDIIDEPVFIQDFNFDGPFTATGPISLQDLEVQKTLNNANPNSLTQLNTVGSVVQGTTNSENPISTPVNIVQGATGAVDLSQVTNTGPVSNGDVSQVTNVLPSLDEVSNVQVHQLGNQMIDGGIDGVNNIQAPPFPSRILPAGVNTVQAPPFPSGIVPAPRSNHAEVIKNVLQTANPGQAYECKLVSV